LNDTDITLVNKFMFNSIS